MLTIIGSAVVASVMCLIFVEIDLRRLKREYETKCRALDDQIRAFGRLNKTLADEQVEINRKGAILAELIQKAKPLIDQLDKRY